MKITLLAASATCLLLSTPALANNYVQKAIATLANNNVICETGRLKDATPTIQTCVLSFKDGSKVTMSISEWAGSLEQWINVEGNPATVQAYVEQASFDFISPFVPNKSSELIQLSKKVSKLPLSDNNSIDSSDFDFQLPSKRKVLTKGYYFITTSTSKKLKM